LQLTAPALAAISSNSGDFLLAKVFPLEPKEVPVSGQLWSQFEHRDDLIYYDWEITGLRLKQWRLLTELLPVFPPPTHAMPKQPYPPLDITESWLAELSPALANTVTEVTRTSPTQLTVVRNSQFLFTGLELVLLSHWLADAPVGPIDYSLLPEAKMTGPGVPRRR
jgi:hypothetical protein